MKLKRTRVKIDGNTYELEIKPCETLLESLIRLGIISNFRDWCERGECGSCLVLIDGKPVNSCLVLTVEVCEREILTVLKGGE